MEGLKTCSACSASKELSEFYKDSRNPNGYRAQCKICYGKIYPFRTNEKSKIAGRKSKKSRKGVLVTLLGAARARAKSKGLLYDLDFQWLSEKIEAGTCELSGIVFELPTFDTEINAINPYSPSIDKINARGDYTKSNCRVICFCVNMALSNWGDEVLYHMCESVIKKRLSPGKTNPLLL